MVSSQSVSIKQFQRSFVWSYRSVPCNPKGCIFCGPVNICLIAARQSPHVVDFLCLFHTCFRHHHVHDFLQLAVGVIWCFKFNCEISSVGRAFNRNHSASVNFVCKRTIKPETDPLSLLCHGFDRDSMVIGLLSRSLVTSKRRPSSHATDLPAVAYGTPASASQWHFYPRVARCRAGTTFQHAAHRILTARPTDSVLSPVNLLRTQLSSPIYVPNVVTIRHHALNPILSFVPISVPVILFT